LPPAAAAAAAAAIAPAPAAVAAARQQQKKQQQQQNSIFQVEGTQNICWVSCACVCHCAFSHVLLCAICTLLVQPLHHP
jgi:hypothetical protein